MDRINEQEIGPLVRAHGSQVSQIGGIAETQEMLDFCAEHGVIPQVEMITGEDITTAYDNIVASRVRYRYVIDTSTFPETA